MIIKRDAANIVSAACDVTTELLNLSIPLRPVIIKPNLVEPSPPPVTTDVRVVKGIIRSLHSMGVNDITVAEGSGTGDTKENYKLLGYSNLEANLVDLDVEKTVAVNVMNFRVWEKIYVPEILLDKYIISVPVLKDHSLCGITASLKNMVGVLPARHYSGYWEYKKSQIHRHDTDGCIADLISIVKPDIAIIDASVGLRGHHLSGTPSDPPLNMVYGSSDALEADRMACELLGKNWKEIGHLRNIAEDRKKEASNQQSAGRD